MSIPSIIDQVFAASEKFHKARIAYEVERDALRELEQQLLRYTEDYQALPEQAEYVGDGTWRVFNGTLSAAKRGIGPATGSTSATPSQRMGSPSRKPQRPWRSSRVNTWPTSAMRSEPGSSPRDRKTTQLI